MYKLILAASSGGHVAQVLRLSGLQSAFDCALVTESVDYRIDSWTARTYLLPQINRKDPLFLWRFLRVAVKSCAIWRKERADAVVCTGALAVIPICLLAKLHGKKLIYIESFARIDSPSFTGKLMYRFADSFFVQWESMLKYFPKAIYGGSIY